MPREVTLQRSQVGATSDGGAVLTSWDRPYEEWSTPALVERYGPAPKAFLVVPMVGAFFIDFTNAIIITVFLNLFG